VRAIERLIYWFKYCRSPSAHKKIDVSSASALGVLTGKLTGTVFF